LQQAGINDRKLCDYIASLLEAFSRSSVLRAPHAADSVQQYISDMLIALRRVTPEQAFLLRAHVGNYSLFISGIFLENTQRRSLRGGPDVKFYEQIGRANYELAQRFRDIRCALNRLSDQLLNLDDPTLPGRPALSL
jgi:hypothetical protein